jgi:Methyltransferase FkbM domain
MITIHVSPQQDHPVPIRAGGKLRTAFNQLNLLPFTRWLLSESARKVLNPFATTSYAQFAEDLLIAHLLGPRTGFYVDVGCHHPVRLSNTYRLYLQGWQGVTIDANAAFGPLFAKLRPKDTFIHAAVSGTEQDVEFTFYADSALSSLSGRPLFESPNQYAVTRIERMRTRQLNTILRSQGVARKFELLSIDIETQDEEVLASLDLSEFQPELIVIEAHGADLLSVAEHTITRRLLPFGYALVAFQGVNLFFRKQR